MPVFEAAEQSENIAVRQLRIDHVIGDLNHLRRTRRARGRTRTRGLSKFCGKASCDRQRDSRRTGCLKKSAAGKIDGRGYRFHGHDLAPAWADPADPESRLSEAADLVSRRALVSPWWNRFCTLLDASELRAVPSRGSSCKGIS